MRRTERGYGLQGSLEERVAAATEPSWPTPDSSNGRASAGLEVQQSKKTTVRLHGGMKDTPPIQIEGKARVIICRHRSRRTATRKKLAAIARNQQDAAEGDEAEQQEVAHAHSPTSSAAATSAFCWSMPWPGSSAQ